jgi:hypothetical protein
MSEIFKRINLGSGWRQFESVEIDFGKSLTVLTGANGSGKTTILNILGKHFGWNISFVSTPVWKRALKKIFWTDVWSALSTTNQPDSGSQTVGFIEYTNGARCTLAVPTTSAGQYQPDLRERQPVEGLNIPSHRPAISYADIGSISTRPPDLDQQYQEYQDLLFRTYTGGGQNPGFVIKRSLLSLAVFGYGNEAVVPNEEFRELFEGFQDKLRQMLPKSLGFKKLEIRLPDVVLSTETGEFALDAMSGGIASLFGITWQIYMFGWKKPTCTVLIDEPENHLHPSMQRQILPSLIAAFPNYQFIVATHSPLIVSSEPSATVYALIYTRERRVVSKKITEADLAGSANKILREILDVQTTLPIWMEERIQRLLNRLTSEKISPQAVYEEIKKEGLEESLGEFVQPE